MTIIANNLPLNNLIFNSIDKVSPYALSQHPETNSLEKIEKYTLAQLAITPTGIAMMWLYINAGSSQFGAKPVSPDVASKAVSVDDVINDVYATI